VAGGQGYVVIVTVPQGQLSAVEAGWKALLASLSPGGAAAPVVPAVPAAEPEAGWKTYRHATGVSLRHPPDWRVQEQNGYPMLIPPDAATENGAPTEIYFAFGESLAGQNIQRTDDPKLLQYLDGQIKSLSPALNRVGAVAPIPVPGRAAATADWEATAQGKTVRARTYVTLINDHVLAIVAMGVREQIATRDAILRRIFATLQFGAAGGGAAVPGGAASGAATASVGDARLLGVWLHEKNFSSGRYSSVDVKTYIFRPDGTFANRGQFVANLEHGDGLGGNEDAGRTTLGADPNQAVGRWQAANGVLTLTWTGGGSEQVRYYIEDPSQPGTTAAVMKKRVMLVTTAEGQKQLWTHQK